MKKFLSDPIIIFMSLAVVYLLGFIGVALLCIFFTAQLFGMKEQTNIERETMNAEL